MCASSSNLSVSGISPLLFQCVSYLTSSPQAGVRLREIARSFLSLPPDAPTWLWPTPELGWGNGVRSLSPTDAGSAPSLPSPAAVLYVYLNFQ